MPSPTKTKTAGRSSAVSPVDRTNRTPKKDPLPDWALKFLTHLRFRGSISGAAMAPKVGRRTVYDLRARNPWFDSMVREIAEECVEEVESTLFQRAVAGESYQPASKVGNIGLVSSFAVWLLRFHSQKARLSVWMSCWRTAGACRLVSMLG
jgi:hypothetical protein